MKTNITTKEALATALDEELLALFNDARAGRHPSGGVQNRETNVTEYDPVRNFQGYYGTEYSFLKHKTALEDTIGNMCKNNVFVLYKNCDDIM